MGHVLLRERSCDRGDSPAIRAVAEVMPADADARAEENSDNCTQAAGSQFRSVHARLARSSLTRSEAK